MRPHTIVAAFTIISLALVPRVFAQPRYEIPLVVTDGVDTQTLYFGIFPGAHYCIDSRDSINGHIELEFVSPEPGVFDARFVWPRLGINTDCIVTGGPYDYLPSVNETQRDTFRVKTQTGYGPTLGITWPQGLSARFTQLTLRYFDQSLGQNVTIDMLTDTTGDVTGAGDPATVMIFSSEVFVSAEQRSPDVADRFVLHQNYPNPFNPETKISFRVTGQGRAWVKVYDVLGREVATLVDGVQRQGEHTVEWRPEGISSGLYIYRLTTPDGTTEKKMLLLR